MRLAAFIYVYLLQLGDQRGIPSMHGQRDRHVGPFLAYSLARGNEVLGTAVSQMLERSICQRQNLDPWHSS